MPAPEFRNGLCAAPRRKLYLFQNVPAEVCERCGEIWIEEKVLKEIDRLIEEGRPIRTEQTPVFDLAGTPVH